MPWKDFVDEQDYSGLLNAIRNESKPSKMAIVVRAFITLPKDKFEEEVVPVIASQRAVLSRLIGTTLIILDGYISTKAGIGSFAPRSTYT